IVQQESKLVKPGSTASTIPVRLDVQSNSEKALISPLPKNHVTRVAAASRKFICSQPFKYGFTGFLLASVINAAIFGTLLGLCLRPTATLCTPTTWSENGTTVAGGNGVGSNLNQLNNPVGIFVDKNKNIYIADVQNERVVKWSQNATVGVVVGGGNGGGANSNQLWEPNDIRVNDNGDIFVADSNNARIQKLSSGRINGLTMAGGNGQGSSSNQFNYPNALAFDSDGNMYVADRYNNRVQKFTASC
ncbi:unnamed protein product, partial [Didymodactylos carnosus]